MVPVSLEEFPSFRLSMLWSLVLYCVDITPIT